MSDRDAYPHVRGSLRSEDGAGVVRLVARLAVPVAEVWAALTEPARLGAWLGEVDGDHTVLALEDRGLPWAQLAAYGAGDQIHVEDLAAHLSGQGRCDARARFLQLHPPWRELAELSGTHPPG